MNEACTRTAVPLHEKGKKRATLFFTLDSTQIEMSK